MSFLDLREAVAELFSQPAKLGYVRDGYTFFRAKHRKTDRNVAERRLNLPRLEHEAIVHFRRRAAETALAIADRSLPTAANLKPLKKARRLIKCSCCRKRLVHPLHPRHCAECLEETMRRYAVAK